MSPQKKPTGAGKLGSHLDTWLEPALSPAPATAPPAPKQEQVNVRLAVDLVDKARDVVFHTPGLTLAELIADALNAEIEKRTRARGEAFPARPEGKRLRSPVRK